MTLTIIPSAHMVKSGAKWKACDVVKKKNTGQDVKRTGFDLFLVVVLPPDR